MNKILFYCGQSYTSHLEEKEVKALTDIDVINTKKDDLPWIQVFNSKYRITNDTLDWNLWNGCVYIDLDTKRYYNEVRKFDPDKLLKLLYDYFYYNYYANFYCIQKSNSGTSYHVIFYFNIEKNYDNYQKCQYWCTEIVREAFRSFNAEEIINYKKVIDKCTQSPVQGMYLTNHELIFGDINGQWFGNFDVSQVEYEYKIINNVKYVNDDGTNNFVVLGERDKINKKKYYEHHTRMAIYMSLISILKDKDKVDNIYSEIINECFLEGEHTIKFFIKEPDKNKWFDEYDKYKDRFVRPWLLKEIGYNIIEKFIPEIYSPYKSDIVYNIESNQYLSDINIEFKKDKINHIFAGCGFGKTTWAKKLSKTKRVCVISPLTSINKDAFSEENNWLIIDNNNKDIIKHIYNDGAIHALESTWNICTTWESFSLYQMYKYDFDYIIIDEIHTLYMYDYRINSIRKLKEDFPRAKGIKVIMTGTPSYEISEFDCYKIQIKKDQPKTNAEFLFYNSSSTGWIYKDIKEWIKDDNHIAILFKDQANYKDVDSMSLEGISCDIFNSNYKENVEYILNENNIKNNVTIFSVYGQAGINLYIDLEKKVRLYILNKNGLGIIQYANRVRNKQVIDKVVIPFKKSFIENKIERINEYIDLDEAIRKVNVLNSFSKPYDIFSEKRKSILYLRFGFIPECLDKIGEKVALNEQNYIIYKMIKNIDAYEKQLQIIYNRLIENDFNVSYNYLDKDTKTNKNAKMKSNQLAGNIVNFDFSQIKRDKDGNIYIEPNNRLLKVCTGNLLEILTNIFNYLNRHNKDIEQEFNSNIRSIIKWKGNITKKDLENLNTLYYLEENWSKFYNSNFIKAMSSEKWDDIKLSAAYIRSIYNDEMLVSDWKKLADEVYVKIHNFRDVYDNYTDIIESLPYDNDDLDIKLDDITNEIYTYIYNKHNRGKIGGKKGTEIIIDGIKYSSQIEASNILKVDKSTILRWLKTGKAQYCN